MTSAGSPLTAGEWGALLPAPTILVRELARAQVPDEPGVYLWWHEGQTVYVGMAASLRARALEQGLLRRCQPLGILAAMERVRAAVTG